MELELRRPQNASITQRQNKAQAVSIPLGTAQWHSFPKGVNPTFNVGDIFVGRTLDGHPIGIKDQGHISVLAKTRFGKGAGIVVPNLIMWPGSVVVIDIKGENAILTARRRGFGSRYAKGLGQRVYLIDPFLEARNDTYGDDLSDLRASFNPLDMLGVNRPESVDDAARIAGSVIDPDVSVSDPFWNESARTLIQFIALHVCSSNEFAPEDRNLLTVRDLILEGYAELRSLLEDNLDPGSLPTAYALLFRAMTKNQAFNREVSKAGAKFARMHDNSPRMLESVAQVACSSLDWLASEAMQASVARSSFSLSELKTDPRGVSLYLCLPQRFMDTHYRFFRMMIALLIAEMERIRHQPRSGHPMLMVLDEFAGLKRMHMIEHAAAQIAGSGVKMMFVVQTLGQLKKTYKENFEFALANSSTQIFFGNSGETAEFVSKLTGDVETVRQTRSQSASHGTSNSNAFGETMGHSVNHNTGQNAGWSVSSQGTSFSGSASSGRSHGSSFSRSTTNTYGKNASETSGANETLHKRPLLSPDEVNRYFSNNEDPMALVLLSGQNPMAVRRVSYFAEAMFAGKFDPHPDHPLPPSKRQLEARDAEIKRQLQAERRRAQEQKAAAIRKKNEEIRRRNDRYFAERRQKREWELQAVQERIDAARRKRQEELRNTVIAYGWVFAFFLVIFMVRAV